MSRRYPISPSAPSPAASLCQRPIWLAVCLGGILLSLASPSQATVFCVSNSAELQNALDTAESNGVDDEIRLIATTFPVPGGGFRYNPTEVKSLTLIGGHFHFLGVCSRLSYSAFSTTLDGGGNERVLDVFVNLPAGSTGTPHFHFEGLTFANGHGGVGDAGVGLAITTMPATVNPTVEVIGNAFLQNWTSGAIGALDISVGNIATVRVLGNLFAGNHGGSSGAALAIFGQTSLDAAVNNNTFSGNTGSGEVVTFLDNNANSLFWASNNLFWNNGGDYDFFLGVSGNVALVSNNYPRNLNASPTLEIDRYAVDPRFVDAAGGNYDLKPDSPLAGHGATPPQGGAPTYDVLGRARLAGRYLDLGAYEIQVLTSDGFESGSLAVWSAKRP